MMRFTKALIQKVLEMNEGFTDRTYYKSRNSEEENHYSIKDGKLFKRSIGKTSWSDSRYDKTTVCDEDQTRRFLRERKNRLKIEE